MLEQKLVFAHFISKRKRLEVVDNRTHAVYPTGVPLRDVLDAVTGSRGKEEEEEEEEG